VCLKQLAYLKLESNELSSIDPNLFYGLVMLRNVNLINNKFVRDQQIELNGIDSKLIILC